MIKHNQTNKWIALALVLLGVGLIVGGVVLAVTGNLCGMALAYPGACLIGWFGMELAFGEGKW